MIRRQLKTFAFFLVLFLSAASLYGDYIVTEKGEVGDLKWWSDQVLTNGNTLYILGHMKNVSDETVYKLYTVDTVTNAQSDVALLWEDDSPVTVSQKFIGLLGNDAILIHWWEKDYYSTGIGAEVTGRLDITAGKVTRWQADPAPAFDAAATEKTGIIADIISQFTDGAYALNGSEFLKQGMDRDGNTKLYRFNTETRITDASATADKHSLFLGNTGTTPYVFWDETGSGSFKYGQMQTDGTINDIKDFSSLKTFYRSVQQGSNFLISGLDTSDQKRLYHMGPDYLPAAELKVTSLPFVDQTTRYDLYAVNENGDYITLWWDATAQKQKYGTISNNSAVTLMGNTSVSEDAGSVTIITTLSNACSEDVIVYLETNHAGNDTASWGEDYSFGAPELITIPAGMLSGTATLHIVDDTVYDPGSGEMITVFAASLENAVITSPQVVTITITEIDVDADGMPDDWEAQYNVDSSSGDPDHDGLTNIEEFLLKTNPVNHDSDGDGYSDGAEIYHGTDPTTFDTSPPAKHTIYVNVDADGLNTGKTWDDAYTSLDVAMDSALTGDSIWVAAGTYYPETANFADPREAAFRLLNGVSIYGGFSGIETTFDDRDSSFNETIISGDIGNVEEPSDNAYHIFYHTETDNLDETAIIDGFIISGGNANGDGVNNRGGGMYNKGSSPSLSHIIFKENSADYGGGLYSKNSDPVLNFCAFYENNAKKSGGGIQNYNSKSVIENTIFDGNTSESSGGGINLYKSSLKLKNCLFYNNSGNNFGGAVNADNSGIEISGCTFTQNSARYDGGGIYATSGYLDIDSSVFYTNTPDEIKNSANNESVKYSVIKGGYDGEGNIDEDPLFTDPDNVDFRLSADSPCINSGNLLATEESFGLADLAGNPRFACETVDMGAFESEEPVCSSQSASSGKSSDSSSCFIGSLSGRVFPLPVLITSLFLFVLCIGRRQN